MNDEDNSRSSNPTEGTRRRGNAVIVKRKNFHVTTFAECPFFNSSHCGSPLRGRIQLQCWAAFNFAAKIIHHGIHRKHFAKESYLLGGRFFSSWPVDSVWTGEVSWPAKDDWALIKLCNKPVLSISNGPTTTDEDRCKSSSQSRGFMFCSLPPLIIDGRFLSTLGCNSSSPRCTRT